MNDLVMAINASGLVGSKGSGGDGGDGCSWLLSKEDDGDDKAVLSLSMSDKTS